MTYELGFLCLSNSEEATWWHGQQSSSPEVYELQVLCSRRSFPLLGRWASMETSSPCIQTALLRCSICTPTGDAANSMTNSSEVMCLKQKPQRTLIPNYQWTQCYVCRLWISTLPVVGKHERACGVCTHALSHDWICAFFFVVALMSAGFSSELSGMSNHMFLHLGPSSFCCTGRQQSTILCPCANTFWHFAAVPLGIHSQLFTLCTLHCWIIKQVQCLHINEKSIYWLSFCSICIYFHLHFVLTRDLWFYSYTQQSSYSYKSNGLEKNIQLQITSKYSINRRKQMLHS